MNCDLFKLLCGISFFVVGGIAYYGGEYIGKRQALDTLPADAFTTAASQITDEVDFSDSVAKAYTPEHMASHYLISHFAQKQNDWDKAAENLQNVLEFVPKSSELTSRAMVLSLGAGRYDEALTLSEQIYEDDPKQALPALFLALDGFKRENYTETLEILDKMPEGGLSDFIVPVIKSWAYAAQGEHVTENLDNNTIHLFHSILIGDYLKKPEHIEELVNVSINGNGLSLQDVERIADTFAFIGKDEQALELYERLRSEWPTHRGVPEKIEQIAKGNGADILERVEYPVEGVARALYDMATLLVSEDSDDSARVFAHMARYLQPDHTDTILLIGKINGRSEQYDTAISYYSMVEPDDPAYQKAQQFAAHLYEEQERYEDSAQILNALKRDHPDNVDIFIQLGDLYRRQELYRDAVRYYNQAEKMLGSEFAGAHWQVLYVRGIAYEQMDKWDQAEADLMAALEYQPDHPLILNYLGYAWADQGIHLDKSLNLIRTALAARPDDGYITDSLGWVLYRMGRYEEALPYLEEAVELLPYDPIVNDHLGDVYWKVGRIREAKFQWTRAKNFTDDESVMAAIDNKLLSGLTDQSPDSVPISYSDARDTDLPHTEKSNDVINGADGPHNIIVK